MTMNSMYNHIIQSVETYGYCDVTIRMAQEIWPEPKRYSVWAMTENEFLALSGARDVPVDMTTEEQLREFCSVHGLSYVRGETGAGTPVWKLSRTTD